MKQSKCRNCGRPVFTIAEAPDMGWLHYETLPGNKIRSKGRSCRRTYAEPIEDDQ